MCNSSILKPHSVFVATMFLCIFLQSPLPASAQVGDICLPTIGGLVASPTMDGKPQNDVGWNGAGQLGIRDVTQGANGPSESNTRSGSIQYGILNNFLYFSVDLDNGNFSAPGSNDRVVIAISPDGTSADSVNAWRLHISPGLYSATSGIVIPARPPLGVAYWRDSSSWNNQKPTGATCTRSQYYDCNSPLAMDSQGIVQTSGGAQCNPLQTAQFVVSRNGSRWGLEAKVPYSTNLADAAANCKIYIPSASTFKVYANVVSTNDLVTSTTYVEDPWPSSLYLNANNGLGGLIETSTPAPSAWGVASLDANPPTTTRPACTGVKIAAAGVRPNSTSPLGTTSYAVPGAGVDPVDSKYYYLKDPANASSLKLKTADECAAGSTPNLNNDAYWPTSKSNSNTFVARAVNNGTGTPSVSAKFYIAPWGLPAPGDWDLIGERYKPSTRSSIYQSASQPIGTSTMDLTTDWQLSYKESCAYVLSNVVGYSAGKPIGHHCVQAELESTGPTVNFITKSMQFNHNVIPASRVEHQVTIGTKGYGTPPSGKTYHEILLSVDQLARKYVRDGNTYYPRYEKSDVINSDRSTSPAFSNFGAISGENFPKGMTEALAVVARGYRITGDKLVIGGTAYKRAQYIGAFSLEAGHNGTVDKWDLAMAPTQCPPNSPQVGCMSGSGGNYVLQIPKDQSVQVTTAVEAKEPGNGPKCLNPCGDPACYLKGKQQASNDSGAISGTLALVGTLGAGGFAFLRRRRNQKPSDRHTED